MKKVLTILLTLSFLFCFGTLTLATANLGDEVKNSVHKAENSIGGAVQNAGNATRNAVNSIDNGMNNAGRAVQGAVTNGTHTTNNGYTATRTATTNATTNTMAMTWSWIIVGATVLIIGGLVWYYVSDTNMDKIRNER